MTETEDCIFLHFPKTGSSWLRSTIQKGMTSWDKTFWNWVPFSTSVLIHNRVFSNRQLYREVRTVHPGYDGSWNRGLYDGTHIHGTRSEMESIIGPNRKQVIATIRDVHTRFISIFNFGWWSRFPEQTFNNTERLQAIPEFPDIGPEAFYELSRHSFSSAGVSLNSSITQMGFQSKELIRFFASRNFLSKLKEIRDDEELVKEFLVDIERIRFLFHEELREGAQSLFMHLKFPENAQLAVRLTPAVNVSKSRVSKGGIGEDLWKKITHEEWFYLRIYSSLRERK